jgi:hypothetical protein
VLRLTLLAPDFVEAILGGRQPAEMTVAVLMRRFAVGWDARRSAFALRCFDRRISRLDVARRGRQTEGRAVLADAGRGRAGAQTDGRIVAPNC